VLDGAWPYVIVGGTVVVLAVISTVVSRIAWRRQVQRFIEDLLGRNEAIGLALRTTQGIIDRLARGTVADVLEFATPDSDDRAALGQIGRGMRIQADELSEIPLPRRLWKLADQLGVAASAIASQTSAIAETEGEAVLDALGALDLGGARRLLESAESEILLVSARYGLIERRKKKKRT
jgi:hypothetical protein